MATAQDLLVEVGLPGSATTLDSNYTIGDATVTVVATTNWPVTGKPVIFAIDEATVIDGKQVQTAGTYNVFEGIVASATSISSVDQEIGSGDRNYTAGVLTRVYIPVSTENINRIVEWGTAEHKQDGTHGDITVDSITLNGQSNDGWLTTGGTHSVATGYNAGNRSFTVDTSTDLTAIVSPGMRYRTTRNTVPATQCADLEASSSQYASKSSPTGIDGITDTISIEGWATPESYVSGGIVSRIDANDGWALRLEADGIIRLSARTTSGGTRELVSYQSVKLGSFQHLAATFTASTGVGAIYLDGVVIPSVVTGTDTSIGVPSADLEVGALAGSPYFDGKLSDVRVWSDIRTATEIQDNMFGYPSDTTGLVAHWKLAGDFTDSSSNSNDLTTSGGAGFVTDNPWNPIEYGIITAVSATQLQVQFPTGYGLPLETLTAPFYSTQSAPFGFPRGGSKWTVDFYRTNAASNVAKSAPGTSVWYNVGDFQLSIPIGDWDVSYINGIYATDTSGTVVDIHSTLSTGASTESNDRLTAVFNNQTPTGNNAIVATAVASDVIELTVATIYYLNLKTSDATVDSLRSSQSRGVLIRATCAYL